MSNTPTLSIITINRNNAEGLRKTMESVFSQTGLEKGQLEYIIIDGASTDNSVEVINEFLALPENNEKVSYWISEPDKGIYNAMNKGINHANGEYCLFLNSGDRFLTSDILEYSLKILLNTNTIYYGNVQNSKNGKLTHIHFYPEQIDVNYFISKTINHQNTFIPVKYLRTYGLYNTNYLIVADWLFFLKCANLNIKFEHLPLCIVEYDNDGFISLTTQQDKIQEERQRGITEIFENIAPSLNELCDIRKSVYGNTISLFGYTKFYEVWKGIIKVQY